MAKLSAWLKKHLSFKPGPKKQSTDPLPFLPSSRRSLTLTSFDTQPCLFFQLPYDVRSIILFMAFGGRILHVDIVRREEAWQWRGAVCGRSGLPPMRYYRGLWNDSCLQFVGKGKFRKEYIVGVLGFLLSCRQAYNEGIDVLYSTNYIHIQSEPLLLHLPQLISPNRLASITSLEIVIAAHYIKHENSRPTFNLDHLKPILDKISTHCNRLRSLYLSLTVASRVHEMIEGPALPLVDAFYRSIQLRRMGVELPSRSYWSRNFKHTPMDYHPRETPAKGPLKHSLWRSLDGEEPRVQSRVIERYPYPPLRLPVLDGNESVESAGYWLIEGDEGPINLNRAVCF